MAAVAVGVAGDAYHFTLDDRSEVAAGSRPTVRWFGIAGDAAALAVAAARAALTALV